jgi:hypothetical protein
LLNSFDQDSFDATGSMKASSSSTLPEARRGIGFLAAVSERKPVANSSFAPDARGVSCEMSILDAGLSFAPSSPLKGGVFGLKNPFKLCCPFLLAFLSATVDPDFARFGGGAAVSLFCGRFAAATGFS